MLVLPLLASAAFAEEASAPRHNLPFIYYLQGLTLENLSRINPAVAVIDPYDSGLEPKDIAFLKRKYRQTLVGYLSAGEVDPSRTERYDGYAFHEDWNNADWYKSVPAKVRDNENWGTKRVEYWNAEWRAILAFRVRKLIELGYDGVMLDTVDSFTAMESAYARDVKQDMANLIGFLRDVAKAENPDFLIYINGGMELYDTTYTKTGEEFLVLIDGQLKEDTWYNEKGSASAEWTTDDIAYLKRAVKAGKPVFTIDYFTNESFGVPPKRRMSDFMLTARKLGAIPFAADRSLGKYLLYNETFFANDFNWDTAKNHGITP